MLFLSIRAKPFSESWFYTVQNILINSQNFQLFKEKIFFPKISLSALPTTPFKRATKGCLYANKSCSSMQLFGCFLITFWEDNLFFGENSLSIVGTNHFGDTRGNCQQIYNTFCGFKDRFCYVNVLISTCFSYRYWYMQKWEFGLI